MLSLALVFLKIGVAAYGGGWTIVGIIKTEIVGRAWLSAEEFARLVAVAQITPGPVALNAATMVGYKLHGLPGAAVATLSVVAAPLTLAIIVGGVMAKAAKKAGRATSQGVIGSYIHNNGKIGVMVELKCETDFVAKNEKFLVFAKDLAMQIAATSPLCVSPEQVPADLLAKEREIFKNQAMEEGKPEAIAEKIVEGRLKKYYAEVCLLEQPFIKEDKKTIKDLLNELISVLGENMQIGRFQRMVLGEGAEAESGEE